MKNNKEVLLINLPLWYYQSVPIDLIYAAYQFDIAGILYTMRDLNLEMLYNICEDNDMDIVKCLNNENLFYNKSRLTECYRKLEALYNKINTFIFPNKLGINYFNSTEDIRSLFDIESIVMNKQRNPYIEFFEKTIDNLIGDETKFIAFPLFHPDQIIPLFTLCRMIKEKNYKIHIHVYGNLEDQINTKLLFENVTNENRYKLGKYVDSIGTGESHKYIVKIYQENVHKDISSDSMTALYQYEEKDIFDINNSILDNLPKSYFMPTDILNIVVSLGCYWGRCNYCSIKEHNRYKKKNIDGIIAILKVIYENGKFPIIRFRDCCLSPRDLDKVADRLLTEDIQMKWCCRARLEKEFNQELFIKLKKAGCIMISFGIESFHINTSSNMNKGIDVDKSLEIIKACHKAGIAVKLTAITGFPTESFEEALYNIAMLKEASKFCVDVKVNKFILFNNTDISSNPEKYGIIINNYIEDHSFQYYSDYITKTKLDYDKQQILTNEQNELYKSLSPFISEEHLLLYLCKYDLEKCMGYVHNTK
jgi:Fe-S oxidoreductase